MRAQLSQREGGGWVSLLGADGRPQLARLPEQPPEVVADAGTTEEELRDIPAVWPALGVCRPEPWWAAKEPEEETRGMELPRLLAQLGGGRVACDWKRQVSPALGGIKHTVWRSPFTGARTSLDQLLQLHVWKACVVEKDLGLRVREAMETGSTTIAAFPRGALVVAEWVNASGVIRLTLPTQEDVPKHPRGFAELDGGLTGTVLAPLTGGEFWVEPRGGHLPEERQMEPDTDRRWVTLRAEKAAESAEVCQLWRGDAVRMTEMSGRCARVVVTHRVRRDDPLGDVGWVDLFDDAAWSVLRKRFPDQIHPTQRKALVARYDLGSVPEAEAEPTVPEEAEVATAGVPRLLIQVGALEAASVYTKEWREARDPIWGRRYFVNRWSGQVIHRLASRNVAYAAVKLRLWMHNLGLEHIRCTRDGGKLICELQEDVATRLAAMADVPEDLISVSFLEGPEAQKGSGRPSSSSSRSSGGHTQVSVRSWGTRPGTQEGTSAEDSILGSDPSRPPFCIVATIRAPGVRAAWASAGLRRAMARERTFTRQLIALFRNIPHFNRMRVLAAMTYGLASAELEELHLPREAEEPVQAIQLPDDDIAEVARNMQFARPKLLQYPYRPLGGKNVVALCDALQTSSKPHLEEISMWNCDIGDEGATSLGRALRVGVGGILQTLLLDENDITDSGVRDLAAGLKKCPQLTELSVARNPLGMGFVALVAALPRSIGVLDASETGLDDGALLAAVDVVPRWQSLRTLRLAGNPEVTNVGMEALLRALLLIPSLRLCDVHGSGVTRAQAVRLGKILEDGGLDSRVARL